MSEGPFGAGHPFHPHQSHAQTDIPSRGIPQPGSGDIAASSHMSARVMTPHMQHPQQYQQQQHQLRQQQQQQQPSAVPRLSPSAMSATMPVPNVHSGSPPFRHVFQRLAGPGSQDPSQAVQPQLSQAQQPSYIPPLSRDALDSQSRLLPQAQSLSPLNDANSAQGSTASGAPLAAKGAGAAASAADAGLGEEPKKRTSKACEVCRVRRTKCIGGRPCDPCKALGVADDCIVRIKARPNRALPKTLTDNGVTTGPQFDSAELARLGRSATADGKVAIELPDRPRETSSRSAVPATPTSSKASSSRRSPVKLSAPLSDLPRQSRLPDAMKRYVPPPNPVVESPHSSTLHTTFVEDIEASLESWARERGEQLSLSLSAPSPLLTVLDNPPPLPPLNSTVEEQAIKLFLRLLGTYFDFLPPQRLTDLTARYHTAPNTMSADQRCLVWACICLGMFRERRWPANDTTHVSPAVSAQGLNANTSTGGPMGAGSMGLGSTGNGDGGNFDYGGRLGNASYEEAPYYAACVKGLDEWGSASSTALTGGPQDMRDILGRMAWQVKELGFHRDVTAKLYPASDAADRLFFMTLYKDSWFATLTGLPPFLSTGTFDTHFTQPSSSLPVELSSPDYQRGLDAHPFLVQLTLFENELATLMHVPDTQVSIDVVLDLERKWGDWMVVFRDDQLKGVRPMHHAFSMIRFHWIRLMLRTPFLSSSSLRLSSLSIISRSIAQILNSYATLAHTQVFIASYGELKRIMTCGYLLCVCFWERELDRNETESLMGLCEWLVSKLEQAERQGDGGVARGKGEILRKLSGLLDLRPKSPASPLIALPYGPDPSAPPVDEPPGTYIAPAEFEAQQTVDALFGYPYALDWSMPGGVDNWLGLGNADYMASASGSGGEALVGYFGHPPHSHHPHPAGPGPGSGPGMDQMGGGHMPGMYQPQ